MALGAITSQRAAYEDALRWLEEAAEERAALGDVPGRTAALLEIGNTYWRSGKLDRAKEVLATCLEIEGDAGDPSRRARAYQVLGNIAALEANLPAARASMATSLALRRSIGDKPGIATMMVNMTVGAFMERKLDAALALGEEGYELCTELGMRWEASRAGEMLAHIRASLGEAQAARRLFKRSLAQLRDLGALRELAELMVSQLVTWRLTAGPEDAAYVLRIAAAGTALFESLKSPVPRHVKQPVDARLVEMNGHFGEDFVTKSQRNRPPVGPWPGPRRSLSHWQKVSSAESAVLNQTEPDVHPLTGNRRLGRDFALGELRFHLLDPLLGDDERGELVLRDEIQLAVGAT
jgi:hypothetical protein